MHVRISKEHLDDIIESLQTTIERNLTFVNNNEYAQASGYARGGLMGTELVLKTIRETNMYEDEWDYASPE